MSKTQGTAHAQVIHLRDRQRLIMTYDGDETNFAGPETAESQIRSLVQSLEGSHVGIFQRCVGLPGTAQKTSVPGLEPRPYIRHWIDAGVDQMAYFVDECHKCGMQAWGSCRMNDAHHTYSGLDYSQPKFYREHPELRLRSPEAHQISATYDLNKPLVIEQNLAFLTEVAETWDVDGIDLDFTRSPPYFNPDEVEKGRETMNQHLRNVRAMLDDVGSKKGKRLGFSAQLYTHDSLWRELDEQQHGGDIEGFLAGGLDVHTWAAEVLDILIAHCRSASLYEMDIAAWRRAVEGTNCRLMAGPGKPTRFKLARDGLIDGFPASRTNRLQHRAIAHRLYEQGAEGIAFYDYLVRNHELQWEVFRELGDPERIRRANKTYVFQMALPLELGLRAQGGEADMQIDLPEDISAAGSATQVRLLLNITKIRSVHEVSLKLNGHAVTVTGEKGITLPLTATDHPEDAAASHLQAVIEPTLFKYGRNQLTFTLRPTPGDHEYPEPRPAEVRKVDLEIIYRDETYPDWLAVQMEHNR